MRTLLFVLLLAITVRVSAQDSNPYLGVIPAPVSVKASKGEFKLTPETLILVDSPGHKAVLYIANYMTKAGYGNSVTDMSRLDKKRPIIKNTITLLTNFKGTLPPEGYELNITDDQVTIKGRGAGLFYGVQTLLQLIHKTNNPGYATIPCATIKDYPRFSYRGMHLDVSRHFFDVDFIKKYLDLMAAYKLNNFHWHLTDDQGWRLEIKKYPKLTEVGSKRAQTKIGRALVDTGLYDNTPYGGFYTQDQVNDIVNYAIDRYINVIPEIEMPGHSLAAIASYPEMSCEADKPYKVAETWGVMTDVYCPTEVTFKMLDDILLEVTNMFPSKYIHIGGDECPKAAWKKSEYCRNLIATEGLRGEEGLQSYFIQRIEKYLNSQGRSIIGWDEILEGGVAPNATVMSWRGESGGIAAAQLGHDVIMTPSTGGLYFDHAQSKSPSEPLNIGGNAPLSKTYAYDPLPATLTPAQQKHILGVQANLWTEYITTPAKAEYMLLPRMLALSEVAWTAKENKNYDDFTQARLSKHLARFDAQGINFRVPEAVGSKDTLVEGDQFNIVLKPLVEGAKIYYTLDGSNPSENDQPYLAPIQFTIPAKKTIDFKTITITPSGKRSVVNEIKMKNAGTQPAEENKTPGVKKQK
jgi:hexosaminidase